MPKPRRPTCSTRSPVQRRPRRSSTPVRSSPAPRGTSSTARGRFAYDDADAGLEESWFDQEEVFDREIASPSRRSRGSQASTTPTTTPSSGTAASCGCPRPDDGDRILLTFGAVDYHCDGLGQRPPRRRPRGRTLLVHPRRHDRPGPRRRRPGRRGARRGLVRRRLPAARQAGLGREAPHHLVPPHHGHLAAGVVGTGRTRPPHRPARRPRRGPGPHRRGGPGPEVGRSRAGAALPRAVRGRAPRRDHGHRRRPRRAPVGRAAVRAQLPGGPPDHVAAGVARTSSTSTSRCSATASRSTRSRATRASARWDTQTATSCSTTSPYFLRLVLGQGYWPESHLAAPLAGRPCAARSS